ncbi:sugar nucleotide-binding protein [Riemerella anatipestifer]|uniref:sugar nucleotide-binding protein n=1 Tax=Riemerella anatipestifer TaxID=34085 RepID=UPI0021D57083|nr:sugar nucleotide-binding protein [Riemerella anatipestifer]MCU7570990.1 sugar nucleotide-binding protein [Riemerella anatipestifer]
MKKVLVFGSMGMAGFVISKYLSDQGHEVLGFARRESPHIKYVVGDIFDQHLVKDLIESERFDYIINCVGVLNNSAEADKMNAVYINSFFPHFISKLTQNIETRIIHMSTDCVFSGNRGEYKEDDFTDGPTFYDRSKALGELIDNKNITLRNSIVGPDINSKGIGLLNWFMNLPSQTKIKGFTGAIWTGLTTLELSKIIDFILKSENHYFGLTNMVNNKTINKFELLTLFNSVFRENDIQIEPYGEYEVNKSLIRTNFDIDYKVPSYKEMIIELKKWMDINKNFFPHYQI